MVLAAECSAVVRCFCVLFVLLVFGVVFLLLVVVRCSCLVCSGGGCSALFSSLLVVVVVFLAVLVSLLFLPLLLCGLWCVAARRAVCGCGVV